MISSVFYLWLSDQKQRTDEIGLVAQEATKDKTFPRTAHHLYLFLHYYDLEPRNRQAIKSAHREWRKIRDEKRLFLTPCKNQGDQT